MRMHLLSGGRLQMPRRTYYPDSTSNAWIEMPVSCVLLKHPQGNVLFDTGCNPAAAQNSAWWGRHARYCKPIFDAEASLLEEISKTGLSPSDIDVVICSHLHFDHCGCNAYFDRATILCSSKELDSARATNADSMGYIRGEWDVGQPMDTIDGDHDLFGDGRITLIPLPGHTLGMMGAHVVLDQCGAFVLASDAVPVGASLRERYAPRNTADVELYMFSLEEISRLECDGATILFGHDDEQWKGLRKADKFYE